MATLVGRPVLTGRGEEDTNVKGLIARTTSRAGQESAREAAFQRAMTLMTSRCDSTPATTGVGVALGGVLGVGRDVCYGPKHPQYFYVQQRKPSPMSPLKVWKGYHGNVYFEPMQINRVKSKDTEGQALVASKPQSSLQARKSASSRRTLTATSRSQTLVARDSRDRDSLSAVGGVVGSSRVGGVRRGAASAKSKASSVAAAAQHHVLYLDRQAILCPDNAAMHDDLLLLEKQQSTGSLNLHQQKSHLPATHFPPPGGSTRARSEGGRSGAKSAKFDRVCKGSVVLGHRRAKSGGLLGNSMARGRQRRGEGVEAGLVVVGDRFAAPSVMSPLLRTQTQFSLSSQRLTMNSPDLYAAFERLPPLEQVRISLRHMEAEEGCVGRGATPYSTSSSLATLHDLKPLIKYSADVKAQYNRHIKYY